MSKRALFTLFAAIGIAASVSAQDLRLVPDEDETVMTSDDEIVLDNIKEVLKPYTLSIGPKVGGNYAMPKDDMDLGLSGSMGFNAGVAFNLRFARPAGRPFGTERFGIHVEALYSTRNLSGDNDDISLSCYEIPVLFQWYFIPNFAIEAGPTFTGAISASPTEFECGTDTYHTDQLKARDIMFSVGLNCKLRKGFTADLRYNLGNSNLAGNFETKVSTLSLSVGWLFSVIK